MRSTYVAGVRNSWADSLSRGQQRSQDFWSKLDPRLRCYPSCKRAWDKSRVSWGGCGAPLPAQTASPPGWLAVQKRVFNADWGKAKVRTFFSCSCAYAIAILCWDWLRECSGATVLANSSSMVLGPPWPPALNSQTRAYIASTKAQAHHSPSP